jgi:uncharacterized protein YecE (DUF72 family)
LPFFASKFSTVEINGSFYRTPSVEAVQAWHDQTPKGFDFARKASKFITHWKRLSPKCENSIALMDTRLRAWEATARHVYVRGHGPSGRYHGTYPARTLRRWADAAMRWQSEQRQVYIYFDNDQKAAAPKDARRLATMLGTASKTT